MIRLNILVEGQTEQAFVKRVLAPYLGRRQVFPVARLVEVSRSGGRGGVNRYVKVRDDLNRWIKQEQGNDEVWFTTMFDFYGWPTDAPGHQSCANIHNVRRRIECFEEKFADDIDHHQFMPYLQLHEFEALVLCDVDALSGVYPKSRRELEPLHDVVEDHDSPELINDDPNTAPSKRIENYISGYDKVVAGPLVTDEVGLDGLRNQCPHFDEWISKLEQL